MVQRATVLLIDDDRDMRWAMRNILADAGFDVAEAEGGRSGLDRVVRAAPDAVVLDMRMPDLGGDEVLRRLHRHDQGLPVIIVTAHGSISGAVGAIREGAFEYLTKPFRNDHFVNAVQRAIARRGEAPASSAVGIRATIKEAMGQGPAVESLIDQIEAVAETDYSVVIQGETGAGKEVVARNLHRYSRRAGRPLVVVDCGAIAETLTDTEFFGHEKGAYTGAVARHRGWFEVAANGGTIFLDEIGNLSMTGQKALLRTLEERTIHRVGGTELIDLDVRIIAATNDDLKHRAKAGGFREDLYFRLAEYVIAVPPLRARPEDVAFLATRFLTQARASLGRPPAEIAPAALDLMRAYRWPGNVRELRNVMRRAALSALEVIKPEHLTDSLGLCAVAPVLPPPISTSVITLRHKVQDHIRALEGDAVVKALEQARGNKAEAARLLGIDYKTYRTKLKTLRERVETTVDE
ncbi:sigma-54 dependent transcriptional regulator (plasmid) [Methylocella tundrae]|nr:sigma-54 dependent transcriptional regulator [Methylocella tundrae]